MGCSPKSHATDKDKNAISAFNQSSETISEITTDTEIGATVPAHIGSAICHVLIDTEGNRSCMRERFYQTLMLPNLKHSDKVSVRSV